MSITENKRNGIVVATGLGAILAAVAVYVGLLAAIVWVIATVIHGVFF